MSSFRLLPLLCMLCTAVLLTCTACAPRQFSQSSASSETSVSPEIPLSPAPNTEPALPNEPSVPVIAQPSVSEPVLPAPKSPAASAPQTVPPAQLSPPDTSLIPVPDTSAESEDKPSKTADKPPLSPYDFSSPVPESAGVDNSYFSDAAFVGDSRTEGFYLYSGVKQGRALCASGLSVFNLDKKTVLTSGGKSYTLPEALALTSYKKIYLGFGVNELGYISHDAFYQAYCRTIDTVRALQPNAVIYLQTLIPVNEDRVRATGGAGHLNNDRILLYNDLIRKAALEKQVPVLDLHTAFAVDGSLPAQASRDGVHLSGDYCRKQLEYLKSHTVEFDTLYPEPQPETEVPDDETNANSPIDPLPGADPVLLLPEAEQGTLLPGVAPSASGI